MPKKVMVLFAVASLLVFAFAGPRPDPGTRDGRLDARLRTRDSLRMLHARDRDATLPAGIDVYKAIQQVRSGAKPGSPRALNPFGPFGEEFEVAPDHPDYGMYWPVVAFDPTNGQYLVVWRDYTGSKIYGARVEADGTLLDEAGFAIAGTTDRQDFPSVAFDGAAFLVVWQDDRDKDGSYDIYGARVSTGGVPADDFPIYAEEGGEEKHSQEYPWVAFDGANCLVVWQGELASIWDIYGQRVSTSDELVGDPIQITNEEGDQTNARVAFDGTNFLVVWQDLRSDDAWDIYGARATTTGLVYGLAEPISEAAYSQTTPAVAFDGTDYLVVWSDGRNSTLNSSFTNDIYGARVTTAGVVRDEGENAIAFTDGEFDLYPAVAFDGTDYLVVWSSFDDYHIHGRTLSLALVTGTVWDFSDHAENDGPAVACGPVQGELMVAYMTWPDENNDYRIWARVGSREFAEKPDVATVSIQRPVASFIEKGSWPIPPMAQLTNNGDEPRSFEAVFTITNQANEEVYSETKVVLGLRPDTPRSEVFPPFDLDAAGPNLYTTSCATMLAGDDDEDNDQQDSIFQGCDFIDFFDLGDGGLVADEDGYWDITTLDPEYWAMPPMQGPVEATIWGIGQDGYYDDDQNSYLVSPAYEASQDDPAITFQSNFDILDANDGGNFSYSKSSATGPWTLLTPSSGPAYTVNAIPSLGQRGWTGSSDGWKQSVFVLDDVGEDDEFWVCWRFASDEYDNDNYYGWLIDEVAGSGCDLSGKMGAAGFIDTMKVWPNPVHGKGQVSYTLLKAGNVTVKLYDASGRLARQVPTTGFKKGQNFATLDATRLARGVYFVKVEGQSNAKTSKIIIE